MSLVIPLNMELSLIDQVEILDKFDKITFLVILWGLSVLVLSLVVMPYCETKKDGVIQICEMLTL